MITSKQFVSVGKPERYLSDFIIASDQHARVYCYIYDPNISDPVLEDGTTLPSRWSYPDNLWKRPQPIPIAQEDLVGLNHYDIIDNGISFYEPVRPGVNIWLEVATTPEEFGLTLALPFQEYLENLINLGCAASRSAESWADEDIDQPVKKWYSCSDYIDRDPVVYSAKHYASYTEKDRELAMKWANEDKCVLPDPSSFPLYFSAKHYAEYSHDWAQNDVNTPVEDCSGTPLGYSAWAYAQLAYYVTSGIEFIGVWDATTDQYPTEGNDGDPLAHGMWWLVDSQADEGHVFDGKSWYTGDKLYYLVNAQYTGFVRFPQFTHWDRVVDKPTEYPPEDHTHAYATDSDRGMLRVKLTGTVLDIWSQD